MNKIPRTTKNKLSTTGPQSDKSTTAEKMTAEEEKFVDLLGQILAKHFMEKSGAEEPYSPMITPACQRSL